ncbi:MAG: RsmF rRNA methyltransferase first C-terminal domain-containing protein [Clostridiales bacterium]|nr:RsmF rRNA methyltransferase first C-terminal domain-containing protein [Clostridiales bacterium]
MDADRLPPAFTAECRRLLGGEYPAFLSAITGGRTCYGLRANSLKLRPEELSIRLGGLMPIPWEPSGFCYNYNRAERLSKHPYYSAGLYYLQEPSAMLSAALLPVSPGDRVLDMCAAPGGKATQLAAKLAGTGVLVANDVSTSRIKPLIRNLELAGVRNAIVTNADPSALAERWKGWFDAILADVPCSGEGMFSRDDTAVSSWRLHPPESLAPLQMGILSSCAKMLAPGGFLMYSTCTFNTMENEGVIVRFLEENADFSLVPVNTASIGASGGIGLTGCARIWPHRNGGEGLFAALLRKDQRLEARNQKLEKNKGKDKDKGKTFGLADFGEFGRICPKLTGISVLRRGDALYAAPADSPELSGVRCARQGLYLGDAKKGRFEPSFALAMSLRTDEFENVFDAAAGSDECRRYLAGESFEASAPEGYNLFCVDGFPLGFGKVVGGRLKNKRML